FREGMKTLGVLDAIQRHPTNFRPILCHEPAPLTADILDELFEIRLAQKGSNKRMQEEVVVPFWRDYIQDMEDEEGPAKLEKILAFATGASCVPPSGFSPQPTIEFLHKEDSAVISRCSGWIKGGVTMMKDKRGPGLDFVIHVCVEVVCEVLLNFAIPTSFLLGFSTNVAKLRHREGGCGNQ
ncbi:hypothetical protein QQF64_034451, partial [Cirrhinus molitorella]